MERRTLPVRSPRLRRQAIAARAPRRRHRRVPWLSGFACLALLTACQSPFDTAVLHDFAFASTRLSASLQAIPDVTDYPHVTDASGNWVTTGPDWWASGFLPGALWLEYQQTGDDALRAAAIARQSGIAGQRFRTDTHDLGFMLFDSYGNGLRLTGTTDYQPILLDAARSLAARYSPVVGSIRSWGSIGDADVQVIIDNMMNLELLLWGAANGGDPTWRTMAVSHALRTASDHVRPDGSTFHRVIYDSATGTVETKGTVQGASNSSTWARGQAWALYGFTMMYRWTGDSRFLDTAHCVADWFVSHLPADSVPYWDFDAPGIPNEPKDTSAAAIAASGLLELGQYGTDATRNKTYLDSAKAIITSLSSTTYLAEGTTNDAVLLHGTSNKPAGVSDTGLIYGDYFFLEALLRLRWLPPAAAALPVTVTTASAGTPVLATDGDPTSWWSATGDGAWLQLDLGQTRLCNEVVVTWAGGDRRATRFEVQVSKDGVSWTRVQRSLSMGNSTRPETYAFGDRSARFVRVVGHGTTTDATTRIAEVSVH